MASPNGQQSPYQAPQTPQQEVYVAPGIPASTGATYGVDLGEQLMRDAVEIPKVVEKCAKAIEEFGMFTCRSAKLPLTLCRAGVYGHIPAIRHDIQGAVTQGCTRQRRVLCIESAEAGR